MNVVLPWLPVVVLCTTVILGVFYQTHHFDKRFEDMRQHFDQRFDDLKDQLGKRIEAVESRVGRLEGKLEHPVYRP